MYKTSGINYFSCYTVSEVAGILSKSEKTIFNFINEGLKTIDDKKPFLIRGFNLIDFLKNKNDKKRHPLKINEFYCLSCKEARAPEHKAITLIQNHTNLITQAVCPICHKTMNRPYSISNYPELKKIFTIEEKLRLYDSETSPSNFQIQTPKNQQQNGSVKPEQMEMFNHA
jgi:hypothetical protein